MDIGHWSFIGHWSLVIGHSSHDMVTPNTPPRIALLGCGLVGQKRLNNLPPGTVTMACDLNLERASRLASQSKGCEFTDSVEKAVRSPNVDAVMIATVNASLAPLAC